MADSDLSDLLDEVNFSTPERSLLEEATEKKGNLVLGSENEQSEGYRLKVLAYLLRDTKLK